MKRTLLWEGVGVPAALVLLTGGISLAASTVGTDHSVNGPIAAETGSLLSADYSIDRLPIRLAPLSPAIIDAASVDDGRAAAALPAPSKRAGGDASRLDNAPTQAGQLTPAAGLPGDLQVGGHPLPAAESPGADTEHFSPTAPVSEPQSATPPGPVQRDGGPLVSTLLDPVAPALDPVAPVLDPVAPALDPVAPVLDPVAPALDPVAPALAPVAPALDPVAPVLDPVLGSVLPLDLP